MEKNIPNLQIRLVAIVLLQIIYEDSYRKSYFKIKSYLVMAILYLWQKLKFISNYLTFLK